MRLYYVRDGLTLEQMIQKHIDLEQRFSPYDCRNPQHLIHAPMSSVNANQVKFTEILERVPHDTIVIVDSLKDVRCSLVTVTKILKKRGLVNNRFFSFVILSPRLELLHINNESFMRYANLFLDADASLKRNIQEHSNTPLDPEIVKKIIKDREQAMTFSEIAIKHSIHVDTVRKYTQHVISSAHVMQIRKQQRYERKKKNFQDAFFDLSFIQKPSRFYECARLCIRFAGGAVRTRHVYAANLKFFVLFIKDKFNLVLTDPTQVTDEMAAAYKDDMVAREYSPSTIAGRLSTLRKFFRILRSRQFVLINPFEFIRIPKTNRNYTRFEALSEAEIDKFFEVSWQQVVETTKVKEEIPARHWRARRNYMMMRVLFTTGLRVSGLVNLRPCDITLEGQKPNINVRVKSDNSYRIPLSNAVAFELKEYMAQYCRDYHAERDYVFHGESALSIPMTLTAVSQIINKIAKKAGIERRLSPHCARVTFATLSHKKGMPLPELQLRLNHANIQTTRGYIHYADCTKEEWLPDFVKKIPRSPYLR